MKYLKRMSGKIKNGVQSGLLAIALASSLNCSDDVTVNNNINIGANGNSSEEEYTCESGYAAFRECYFTQNTCWGNEGSVEYHANDDQYIDRDKERWTEHCNLEGEEWANLFYGCLVDACHALSGPDDFYLFLEGSQACADQYYQ